MSTVDWFAVRNDYESGMSLRQLAAKYSVSKSAIGKHKFDEKWDQGVDGGQRKVDRRPGEVLPKSTHEKGPMTDVQRAAAQRIFLDAYAAQANVMVAAQAAGIHRTTVYDWLEKDEDFSFAYHQAKEDAKDVLRAEIYRRAVEGWDEPVYQLKKLVGTVRKYDTTLLIFHAKMLMPEYREKSQLDINTPTSAHSMRALQSTLLDALAAYPEAKAAVAAALMEKSHGQK